MSLVIRTGFKVLNHGQFMFDLIKYKKKIHESYSIKPLAEAFAEDYIMKQLKTESYTEPKRKDVEAFKQRIERNKIVHELLYDNPYNVTIVYFPKFEIGRIISENEDHVKNILAYESVHEFNYWDNTEKPDDFTEDAWDLRGRLWEDVLSYENYTENQEYIDGLEIRLYEESINFRTLIEAYNEIKLDQFKSNMKHTLKWHLIAFHGTDAEKTEYEQLKQNQENKTLDINLALKLETVAEKLFEIHYTEDTIMEHIKTNYPDILN